MALPPGTTDEAFFREVDEGLRQDTLFHIWHRWGRIIIGLVVVGLLAFGGVLYYQSWSQRQSGKQGERYDTAINDARAENDKGNSELAEVAKSGGKGFRALALFAQADLLLKKKDVKGAVAKYGAIAADESLAQPFRDEALIRQTSAEFDTVKPEVAISRLQPLAVPDSAWFGSAGEMVAIAYLKQGKRAEAGKLLNLIAKDKQVADSIRQRAEKLASTTGVAPTVQTEEKKAQ